MATRVRAEFVGLADHAVVQTFVSETVLMDLRTGQYFSLDRLGGAMLSALTDCGDLHEASHRLSAGGWGDEAEVEEALRALCDELRAIGLLSPEPGSATYDFSPTPTTGTTPRSDRSSSAWQRR